MTKPDKTLADILAEQQMPLELQVSMLRIRVLVLELSQLALLRTMRWQLAFWILAIVLLLANFVALIHASL
jgi:hypothetical protein